MRRQRKQKTTSTYWLVGFMCTFISIIVFWFVSPLMDDPVSTTNQEPNSSEVKQAKKERKQMSESAEKELQKIEEYYNERKDEKVVEDNSDAVEVIEEPEYNSHDNEFQNEGPEETMESQRSSTSSVSEDEEWYEEPEPMEVVTSGDGTPKSRYDEYGLDTEDEFYHEKRKEIEGSDVYDPEIGPRKRSETGEQ